MGGSRGWIGEIPQKGVPAPIQAGKRWMVERSHAWMNGFGKLRRCTEKRSRTVDFYLRLSTMIVTLRIFIRRAIPVPLGRPTHRQAPGVIVAARRIQPAYAGDAFGPGMAQTSGP